MRVNIDDKLYQKLKEYCRLKGMSLKDYLNSRLYDSLNTDKYGDLNLLFNGDDEMDNGVNNPIEKESCGASIKEYDERVSPPSQENNIEGKNIRRRRTIKTR